MGGVPRQHGDFMVTREGTRGQKTAYHADGRGQSDPADLPPDAGPIADHVGQMFIVALDSVTPRNRNDFEEDQEQQGEAGRGVVLEQLEDVHSALGDEADSDQVGYEADAEDEQFFSRTKCLRIFVHDGRDETFECAELRIQAEHHYHQEEQHGP